MFRTCVAVLGTVALMIAGCGGGKDSSSDAARTSSTSSSGGELTKKDYIAKVNGICKDTLKAQKPFSDQIDKLASQRDLKKLAPIIDGALKVSQTGFDKLRAVPKPSQDKKQLDAFIVTASKRLKVEAQLGTAAKAGDRATAQKIGKSIDPLGVNMAKFAQRYGIKDCGTAF